MNNNYPKLRTALPDIAYTLLGAALLLIPAFINKFPIVNSDTGCYLYSGFLVENPAERPITYGLTIRFFSINGATLWSVVVIQALILSTLITALIKHFFNGRIPFFTALSIYLVLAFATGLSWVASELIADVYTAIGLLCVICLFILKLNTTQKILLYLLLTLSIATHTSHILIFSGVSIVILLFSRMLLGKGHVKRVAYTTLFVILSSICAYSVAISYSANKAGHAFLMASFLDKKVLLPYLHDQCASKNYTICKYKDSMEDNPNWFLWYPGSPFIKEGDWDGTKKEYTAINRDILLHAPYNIMFAKKSLEFTLEQLQTFTIGDGNVKFDEGSNICAATLSYVSHKEAGDFINSRQNTHDIIAELAPVNTFMAYVLVISCIIVIALFFLKRKSLHKDLPLLLFISLMGILINCADCATFAQINGRYGCRVMWLIPFCAILILFQKRISSLQGRE